MNAAEAETPLARALADALDEKDEKDELIRLFMGHVPAAIAMFDLEMRYLLASERWKQDYNLGDRDLTGLSHYEVFPEIREEWKEMHRRCLAGEVARPGVERFVRDDGSVQWIRGEIHPWRHRTGEIGGILMFTEVITERMEAELALRASEEKYRDLIENATDIIYEHTLDGSIVSANAAALRTLGYEASEIVGLPLARLVDADYLPIAAENLKRKLEGVERTGPYEILLRAKDGRAVWLEVSTRLIRKGGDLHSVHGIARDITERKRVEEERRSMEKWKAEFVTTVTHELRTPLTSLGMSLGLLSSGSIGELTPKAREVVGVGERNVERLVSLVNDIMTFERLEAGRLEMRWESIPLADVIQRSLETVRPVAAAEGVELVAPETDLSVRGDSDRLVQVLVNLLSNAVKFSPRGSTVTIATERVNGYAEVRVCDTGRGIPAGQEESVFEPFRQLRKSDSREKGGTGLGLAICKALVAQHGGTIGVSSAEDKGSTFWFRLLTV